MIIEALKGFTMPNTSLSYLNVLFVEDEEVIREHTMISLNYLVKEVQVASNGQEALEVMESFSPDIIISDLQMPIMNGIDFIKTIRKKNKKVPIIVLTAHTDKEYLLELIEMHIEHYITKPMSFEKLINILQKCAKLVQKDDDVDLSLPFNYNYDWENKTLALDANEIRLTRKEVLFLELLIKNKHRVVSYEEIEGCAWENSIMTSGAIRSLIRTLRRKLPIDLIDNLSGIGYKLVSN